MKLLTRQEFKDHVFRRDNFTCAFCSKPAQDAHHIIERKLWSDGGYYIENGVSVCEEHHLACERTDISVEDIIKTCNIKRILPPGFDPKYIYDKWGNIILHNDEQRLKGPLFQDSSVQKILKEHLHKFKDYVKYPRTYHLPWSEGISSDDKVLKGLPFESKNVVVTIKMDGENTTLYHDYMHARSLDSKHHPSRNWMKNFHASIKQDIPKNFRLCGENLYAKHSIYYDSLPSYFLGFSIWEDNYCLPWEDTLEWFQLLNISPVPEMYRGIFQPEHIKNKWKEFASENEGYVVRLEEGFHYNEFSTSVAKFVRKNHVQTTEHWTQEIIIPNKVAL